MDDSVQRKKCDRPHMNPVYEIGGVSINTTVLRDSFGQ